MNKENLAKSTVLSSAGTILVIFLMTAVSDLNAGFKAWLTSVFSHHWIGKSILSIVVFSLLLIFLYVIKPKISLVISVWVLIVSGSLFTLLTFAFFLLEKFGALSLFASPKLLYIKNYFLWEISKVWMW